MTGQSDPTPLMVQRSAEKRKRREESIRRSREYYEKQRGKKAGDAGQ